MENAIKILILEHDPNDLELLHYALKKSGLQYVFEEVQTEVAFEKALLNFKPAIILSDFSLPSFNGFSAFLVKQKLLPETPFLIVSGTIGDENAVELIKGGVTDYVLKEKLYQIGPKITRALNEAQARKQKEETACQLQQREEQLQKILNLSLDVIYTVDQNGNFVTINPAAKLVLDYHPEELIGRNIMDFVHEEDKPKTYEAFANLKYGIDIINHEARYLRKSGIPITLLWSVRWHSDDLGYGVAKDISEVKKAEEKIKNNEKRFRALLQNSTDGLSLVAEDGTVIDRSPAAQQLLGLGPEEISGSFRTENVHPEDLPIIQQAWIYARKDPNYIRTVEFRMKYPDGSSKWLEATINNQLAEPAVKAIVYNFRDITDRKLAEEKIKQSEARLKEAQKIGKIGNWEVNYVTGVIEWSEEIYRIFGMENKNAVPSKEGFAKFIHPDDLEAVLIEVEKSKNKLENSSVDFRFINSKGELRYGYSDWRFKIDKDGNPIAIYGIFQDVTEKKQVEIALEQSETKYRHIFELSPMPMWVFDLETYRFLNVNEAAIRHYDYRKEEFLKMTIKDIRPGLDIEKLKKTVETNKLTNAFFQGTVTHKKKNGELIQVEIQSNMIDYEDRNARIVLATDISEQIKYLEAIESQNKKLREIAWIQSHVVRAPLARIMGLISMLQDDTTRRENFQELSGYITSSAYELDSVIKNIIKETESVEKEMLQ